MTTVVQCHSHHISSSNYTVSQKKQAKLFLYKLCQTSTKSDNFWLKDG